MVEHVHRIQVLDLAQVLAFPRFIPRFNGLMFLVVGDVPVDSEVPVVTL